MFQDIAADAAWRFRESAAAIGRLGFGPDDAPTILDVGGYPCKFARGLAERFPKARVTTVDVVEAEMEGYRRVEPGATLPFDDAAFDVAVSNDTLEHVPPDQRAAFVAELCRVAKRGMAVAAPAAHPRTAAIERALNDCHRELFGQAHPWLGEHVDYGLPSVASVAEAVPAGFGLAHVTRSVDLHAWTIWQALDLARRLRGELDGVFEKWDVARRAIAPPEPNGGGVGYRAIWIVRRDYDGPPARWIDPPDEAGADALALAELVVEWLRHAEISRDAAPDVAGVINQRLQLGLEAAEKQSQELAEELERLRGELQNPGNRVWKWIRKWI